MQRFSLTVYTDNQTGS